MRAVLCVLLILVMRVLNLAVPILYKELVDLFADVTNKTHPATGKPQHFTFKHVGPPEQCTPRCLCLPTPSCWPERAGATWSFATVLCTECLSTSLLACPSQGHSHLQVFYPIVVLYMVAAFLQGGAGTGSMGAINNIRQYLWIPIQQDAFR